MLLPSFRTASATFRPPGSLAMIPNEWKSLNLGHYFGPKVPFAQLPHSFRDLPPTSTKLLWLPPMLSHSFRDLPPTSTKQMSFRGNLRAASATLRPPGYLLLSLRQCFRHASATLPPEGESQVLLPPMLPHSFRRLTPAMCGACRKVAELPRSFFLVLM